jgi:hypothetical protein
MPKLGKVVVSSSRIREMNLYKLIKLLNLEMKEMGKALGIDTSPAKLSLQHDDFEAPTSPAAGTSTQHQIATSAESDDEGEIDASSSTSSSKDAMKVVQECQRLREQSDWTQNLLVDDLAAFRSLDISDAHGHQLFKRLDQGYNLPGARIPCSSAGLVEICLLAYETDLNTSLPVIRRLEQEVIRDLGCTSRVTNCWLDSEVQGFVGDERTVYVNLRPLLLSRRTYDERELFVYLAKLISHVVARVLLPQEEGHSSKHGRMSEDLMARLLLKTNRLAAYATATAATATAGSTPPTGGASRKRIEAGPAAAFSPESSGVERSDKRRRTDERSGSSSSASTSSTPSQPTAQQAP